MDIGIGLPTSGRGASVAQKIDFARRAEANGLAGLGVTDRLVYGNYDPLIALAAAAAVTRDIRLVTGVLLTPYRNTAVLAKQVASLDNLSGGRLILGVGLGGRTEDYTAAGVSSRGRGRRQTEQLREMRRIWAGEVRGAAGGIGPEPAQAGGPPLLVGGDSEPALARMAEVGDGFVARAGSAESFARHRQRACTAWRVANRAGEPFGVGKIPFGLGPLAADAVRRVVFNYFGNAGAHSEHVAASGLVTVDAIRTSVADFESAGCDLLIFTPVIPEAAQVDLLADAVRHPSSR
jgi:alkanesulfonate monooxygenase SsuD/methylene tetrahydromethanopterin reductase-like flavin-dependent oxidoreductase (luciferase family)